jgi:hypothetical protein
LSEASQGRAPGAGGGPGRLREVLWGWHGVALVGVCAAYWGLVIAPVWIRAAHYCFAHYDLGIYTQALARLSLTELNPWLTGRQVFIFNDHFDPVLFLARPFGAGLAQPWAGLAAEALFVFLGAAPLVWLAAKGRLGAGALGLACAMLLLNSGTVTALGFPIHPTAWAVLPLVWLGVALHLGRRGMALGALVLLFACKEEFPFVGVMLAAGLAWRGERRFALQVGVLTAAWLVLVFAVRPWLMGPTLGYGSGLFEGADAGLWPWLQARLTAPGMASRVGSMLLLFTPLSLWAWRERKGPDGMLLSLLVPMLAIRFLGMKWRFHYGAPLMAGAVVAWLPLLASRPLPVWVALATSAILVGTNEIPLRTAFQVFTRADAFPAVCPGQPERLASVRRGLELLAAHPEGRALLSGHLLAHIPGRDEVYTVGGPQPEGLAYRYVLVEKPPHGDAYPASAERVGELIAHWRLQEGTQVLRDDAHVFLAQGRFTLGH